MIVYWTINEKILLCERKCLGCKEYWNRDNNICLTDKKTKAFKGELMGGENGVTQLARIKQKFEPSNLVPDFTASMSFTAKYLPSLDQTSETKGSLSIVRIRNKIFAISRTLLINSDFWKNHST